MNFQLVIGPAIVLGLGQGAYIARMSRSCLLEVIHVDYVRTPRAKGVTECLVVIRHALPNALLPVITLSGVLMGFMLGGSVAIEQAFGVPGLARTLVTAVIERDIIVVQNLVFLYGLIFTLINIIVDLNYAWLDPRIRYQWRRVLLVDVQPTNRNGEHMACQHRGVSKRREGSVDQRGNLHSLASSAASVAEIHRRRLTA